MPNIKKELRKYARADKIPVYMNFFKTGKGEYGEREKLIGVTVPHTRKVAIDNTDASEKEIIALLRSKVHEDRLCGLFIVVYKFQKAATEQEKKKLVSFYIKHHLAGNNWSLIDCIADKILGVWLLDRDKSLLYKYAKSDNLWERRISIITTFHFIKNKKYDDTLRISSMLLNDGHDLIHKASGWMLREVGKRDEKVLLGFLDKNYKKMPRTMLRYAIEKLSVEKKKFYMKR